MGRRQHGHDNTLTGAFKPLPFINQGETVYHQRSFTRAIVIPFFASPNLNHACTSNCLLSPCHECQQLSRTFIDLFLSRDYGPNWFDAIHKRAVVAMFMMGRCWDRLHGFPKTARTILTYPINNSFWEAHCLACRNIVLFCWGRSIGLMRLDCTLYVTVYSCYFLLNDTVHCYKKKTRKVLPTVEVYMKADDSFYHSDIMETFDAE